MANESPYGEATVPVPRSRPTWLLLVSLFLSSLALIASSRSSSITSLGAYLLALVGGTGFLTVYRLRDGKASSSPNYVPSRMLRRLAVLAAVVIVLACAANAFVWATEMAKQ